MTEEMICIGAVCVMAEQLSQDEPARFILTPDPFMLQI